MARLGKTVCCCVLMCIGTGLCHSASGLETTRYARAMFERRGIGRQYVARPFKGGPHNYGVAVDVTLAYCGKEMDMGTDFDSFSDMAHTDHERRLVAQGRMTKAALYHRYLLRKVMTQSGFMIYKREWWHFERHRIAWARCNLKQLDF